MLDPALEAALSQSKRIYLTTWSVKGKPGTVPVWFMVREGVLYFTTLRDSLKARRIKATGKVKVHVGSRNGPSFEGKAEWVDDRPELEEEIVRAYRRKYPIPVGLFTWLIIRRRLKSKKSVVIKVTPV